MTMGTPHVKRRRGNIRLALFMSRHIRAPRGQRLGKVNFYAMVDLFGAHFVLFRSRQVTAPPHLRPQVVSMWGAGRFLSGLVPILLYAPVPMTRLEEWVVVSPAQHTLSS